MFNPLSYLRSKPAPKLLPVKTEEVEEASAALREKLTEFHKSAREFEETAREFLEDKDKFEGKRRGQY